MATDYRLVVCGCRDFSDYNLLSLEIDAYVKKLDNAFSLIIISGGASGADKLGEKYAKEHNLKVELYPALWDKYGKSAGVVRNREMADVSDGVIAFWDGESKGTKSMIESAREAGIPCKVVQYQRTCSPQ